jgi:hypothetical protein
LEFAARQIEGPATGTGSRTAGQISGTTCGWPGSTRSRYGRTGVPPLAVAEAEAASEPNRGPNDLDWTAGVLIAIERWGGMRRV